MASDKRYPDPDQDDRSKIPEEIVNDLNFVKWAVTDANAVWKVIDEIYNGEGKWELLARSSAYGYKVIFDALVENCILAVARLNDPTATRNKKNVTLASLLQRIKKHGDAALIQKVEPAFERLSALAAGCTRLRHKSLAHADRELALGEIEQPEVKYDDIWDFFEEAGSLVNHIREHFDAVHWEYDLVIGADSSGVIESLRILEQFRRLRNEVVREGRITYEEIRQRLQAIKST